MKSNKSNESLPDRYGSKVKAKTYNLFQTSAGLGRPRDQRGIGLNSKLEKALSPLSSHKSIISRTHYSKSPPIEREMHQK